MSMAAAAVASPDGSGDTSLPQPPAEASDIFSLSDQTLSDKLHFVNEIGFGNWGSVWLCRPKDGSDRVGDAKVAVKLVHRQKTKSASARVQSLWNEMKIVRSFNDDPHPSIVPFYSFIITPSYALITMAYLPRLIPVELPEHRAKPWLQSLLSAIAYLHKRGVVHNDIKPANILLSASDVPTIVDFGFAEQYNPRSSRAFISAVSYGTPEYLSPERARGLPHDTRKSDLWSLGITFFELLVGRTPFEHADGETFGTKEELEKYWARTIRGKWVGQWSLSRNVEKLLERMLSPNADLRLTANEAMEDPYWNLPLPKPSTSRSPASFASPAPKSPRKNRDKENKENRENRENKDKENKQGAGIGVSDILSPWSTKVRTLRAKPSGLKTDALSPARKENVNVNLNSSSSLVLAPAAHVPTSLATIALKPTHARSESQSAKRPELVRKPSGAAQAKVLSARAQARQRRAPLEDASGSVFTSPTPASAHQRTHSQHKSPEHAERARKETLKRKLSPEPVAPSASSSPVKASQASPHKASPKPTLSKKPSGLTKKPSGSLYAVARRPSTMFLQPPSTTTTDAAAAPGTTSAPGQLANKPSHERKPSASRIPSLSRKPSGSGAHSRAPSLSRKVSGIPILSSVRSRASLRPVPSQSDLAHSSTTTAVFSNPPAEERQGRERERERKVSPIGVSIIMETSLELGADGGTVSWSASASAHASAIKSASKSKSKSRSRASGKKEKDAREKTLPLPPSSPVLDRLHSRGPLDEHERAIDLQFHDEAPAFNLDDEDEPEPAPAHPDVSVSESVRSRIAEWANARARLREMSSELEIASELEFGEPTENIRERQREEEEERRRMEEEERRVREEEAEKERRMEEEKMRREKLASFMRSSRMMNSSNAHADKENMPSPTSNASSPVEVRSRAASPLGILGSTQALVIPVSQQQSQQDNSFVSTKSGEPPRPVPERGLSQLRMSIGQLAERTIRSCKSSLGQLQMNVRSPGGNTRRRRNSGASESSDEDWGEAVIRYATANVDCGLPSATLPTVKDAQMQQEIAEDNHVDRMTIWMRNVEKVVEDARQNFASSSTLPLPPLPVVPPPRRPSPPASQTLSASQASQPRSNRSSRLPRKLLAANEIFTPDGSFVASPVTSPDQSVALSQAPIVESPRPRRNTIVSLIRETAEESEHGSPSKQHGSPSKQRSRSQGNLFQRPITPRAELSLEMDRLANTPYSISRPSPPLAEVLDRKLFIADPKLNTPNNTYDVSYTSSAITSPSPASRLAPSTPSYRLGTSAGAGATVDSLLASPLAVEPYPASRRTPRSPIPDTPARKQLESVYDRFLMATSGVARVGAGYQSVAAQSGRGPVASVSAKTVAGVKGKAAPARNPKHFMTQRRPMPPPVSSEDYLKSASADELGMITSPIPDGARSPGLLEPRDAQDGNTLSTIRRAFKAAVNGRTISRRLSRVE